MILDYSQNFITQKTFKLNVNYNKKNSLNRYIKRNGVFRQNLGEDFLYSSISHCPFCKKQMKRIHDSSRQHLDREVGSFKETVTFYYCTECGYWTIKNSSNRVRYIDDEISKYTQSESVRRAILNKFEIGSNLVPLDILKSEINKRPEIMYEIAWRKMEDLVQQVFKDFFSCDVKHCGKSHDGGVDLLILDYDNPIIVQVKRHKNPNYTEPVDVVRELLGTMLIKGSTRGIFVTTAKKFSPDSEKVRNEVLEKKRVDYFELIDFDRFCAILNLTKDNLQKPWNIFCPDLDNRYLEREINIHEYEYFDRLEFNPE